jgi:hypothetical protein
MDLITLALTAAMGALAIGIVCWAFVSSCVDHWINL